MRRRSRRFPTSAFVFPKLSDRRSEGWSIVAIPLRQVVGYGAGERLLGKKNGTHIKKKNAKQINGGNGGEKKTENRRRGEQTRASGERIWQCGPKSFASVKTNPLPVGPRPWTRGNRNHPRPTAAVADRRTFSGVSRTRNQK